MNKRIDYSKILKKDIRACKINQHLSVHIGVVSIFLTFFYNLFWFESDGIKNASNWVLLISADCFALMLTIAVIWGFIENQRKIKELKQELKELDDYA